VSNVLKQPALLQSVDTAACLASWQQQGDQGAAAATTSSILDAQHLTQRLQADVVRCIHADRAYSPYCDMAKSLAGGCAVLCCAVLSALVRLPAGGC
jgi:hypothetical protein